MTRGVRVALTLLVTALATAYVLWKIDLDTTADVLRDVDGRWLGAAIAINLVTAVPMAWRWQWLLAAHGIAERFRWLTRAYFVSYAASTVLPTAIGGDAVRIVETSRRHPGRTGDIAATVLLERGLGGAATVLLGAVGFLLAVGRYDVGAYLWVELFLVVATAVVGAIFFARSVRPALARARPLLALLRLERPVRAFYEGVHAFRGHGRVLAAAFLLSLGLQTVRVLAIWACARAVDVELSPRVFYVMGPLFFIVLMVPFTLNGIAVREAFFVSFLGQLGVAAEQGFGAGFLFFVVTLTLAVPGLVVLVWEAVRRG